LWGHYGIAREIAAITGQKLKPMKPEAHFPVKGTKISVEVKDPDLCPRYIGILLEDIKIEPSPLWMQKRLRAVGYRPINNIVDVTNYVMAELGQPLHAFDARNVHDGIVVRRAKKGEEIQTLDNVKRKLSEEMLVISDHKKALAIAGVMGGANSEIDENTTRMVLESATFHPSSVRKTALKLGLRTEAVQRFEKSLDPRLAEQAALRACELLLKICPSAKIAGPKSDVKNFSDKKIVVQINLKRVFSKIGMEIPVTKVTSILESLEFKTTQLPENRIKVEIPSFRASKDISIEDDLVEEIARMYGYENIEPKLPDLPIKLPIENKERSRKHFAREILSMGLGFSEVYNYSFYSLADIKNCLLPEELHMKVKNYLSEDQTHLRVSLVPNMLKNVAANLKHFDSFRIYEIGRTYEDLQEYFPIEEKKICAMIIEGKKEISEPFYLAKGALETFLNLFTTVGLELKHGESLCPYAHPGRYAGYYLKKNGEEIARLFDLHPVVARNYGLENHKIAAFEINFTKLCSIEPGERKYRPIPKFPGITIDVSVLMNKKKEIGQLMELIRNIDKKLIHGVILFDWYEGPNIPADKKALAFQVDLLAEDRTLTEEEMRGIQQRIFQKLTQEGGIIRGLKEPPLGTADPDKA
jgi:phenylalanyl-tRNA synthetase beta chain